MQAKLIKLEAMGERVSGLAGVKPDEARAIVKPAATAPADGGQRRAVSCRCASPSLEQLDGAFAELDERADQHLDLFTLIESRLFEERLAKLMIPNTPPGRRARSARVSASAPTRSPAAPRCTPGSTSRPTSGTPILAAAGGVVLAGKFHPRLRPPARDRPRQRPGHALRAHLEDPGQGRRPGPPRPDGRAGRQHRAARPGRTCTSRCCVEGVPQNPAKFLAGGEAGARLARRARDPAWPGKRPALKRRGVESSALRLRAAVAAPCAQRAPQSLQSALAPRVMRAPASSTSPTPHVAQAPDPDLRQPQRPPAQAVPAAWSQKINALEPQFEALDDAALRAKTDEFRQRLPSGATLDDLLPEAFAVVREAGKRTLKMRHFDVQLIGGMALHDGKIAEMRTGEGKTLVATLPVYLNALAGKGVHVVTVNDYLARRDAEWMGRLYNFLGLTVGVNLPQMPREEKQAAYAADVTYGTNNEFGFDYLRDNMVYETSPTASQRGLSLRDRRRGRLDPDRRGAHAADHQRPGRRPHRAVRAHQRRRAEAEEADRRGSTCAPAKA